jgi:hypothetical protein
MNLIAMILTLIGGGLREGVVNSRGELIKNPAGYEWEQAYEWSVPCEVVPAAKKQGIEVLYIFEFQRVKLVAVDGKEHEHLYSYRVRDRKSKQFMWYYFSVPCSKCQYDCNVVRITAPVGAGGLK